MLKHDLEFLAASLRRDLCSSHGGRVEFEVGEIIRWAESMNVRIPECEATWFITQAVQNAACRQACREMLIEQRQQPTDASESQ